MAFELLKSEIVYPGRAFIIRQDHLRMPDGHETKFDIVEHHGSVVLIPVDEQGNLVFVRQYRHAAGLELLELPAGTLDADEAPEACARREIREETGLASGRLEYLGGFYLAPGYSTEYMHVYLATDLYADPLRPDADEFLTVERYSLKEAQELVVRGGLPDAKTLAALLLARAALQERGLPF